MSMLHRVPHIMKKHISNKMPCNLLFFDTETHDKPGFHKKDVSRQVLNFGYCYSYRMRNGVKEREVWTRFTDIDTFYKAVWAATERKVPLYCFAHNIGFDLTILDFWIWAERKDFKVDYFVDSDPPTFISGHWNDRKVVFIDTLNYWRNSLADIGKSIGVSKLDRPSKTSTKAYWDKYGKQDVVVLEAAVTKLMSYLKDNDLGQFGLSAASLAMSSFKHRFMKHDIFIHDNRHAMACERQAYFGGLSDCLYVGKVVQRTLYKLDVNSMYPSVMRGLFPVKLVDYKRNPTIYEINKILKDKGVIANVEINAKRHVYPTRHDSRLCYCRGSFTTFLCGPELKRAINNDDISRINVANIYDLAPIFRDYIDFFWAERQRYKALGDDVSQYFIKIFMNSLYGKFGQLGYDSCLLTTDKLKELYETYGKDFPDCYRNLTPLLNSVLSETNWQPLGLGRTLTLRRLNNHVKVKVPNGEHNESFPGIAAYVTSYARNYLLELIRCAGEHQTYYVDTDSLIVSKQGYQRLQEGGYCHDKDLGKLKFEESSRSSYFNAPKDYGFNGKVIRKGIRKTAKSMGDGRYSQIQFEGIKSVLRRGGEPFIDVKTIVKQVSGKYNKGVVRQQGWVEPFTLPLPVDPAVRKRPKRGLAVGRPVALKAGQAF